jgi:hypothetical protein
MTRALDVCVRVVSWWTRLYTWGLPSLVGGRRREEIAGDIAGQLEDARSRGEQPAVTATLIASRLVRGAWSDLSWRHEVGRPVRLARWRSRRGWWCLIALMITFGAAQVWAVYRVYPIEGASVQATSLINGPTNPSEYASKQTIARTASRSDQLSSGAAPSGVLPPAINLATSTAPFVIVYDSDFRVLASSARLHGRTPVPPALRALNRLASSARLAGRTPVLSVGRVLGQLGDLTWQIRPGLSEAVSVESYDGPHPGFVLGATSLQSISAEQTTLTWIIALACLAALALSFVIVRALPSRDPHAMPGSEPASTPSNGTALITAREWLPAISLLIIAGVIALASTGI